MRLDKITDLIPGGMWYLASKYRYTALGLYQRWSDISWSIKLYVAGISWNNKITTLMKALNWINWISTHLKLCLTTATHNFKWVKITHIIIIWHQPFSNLAVYVLILNAPNIDLIG